VIVISYALWTGRFASDSQVVGRTVKLGSVNAMIVA